MSSTKKDFMKLIFPKFRGNNCDRDCDDSSLRLWNVDVTVPHRHHLHHHRHRHQHLCYRVPTVISDQI